MELNEKGDTHLYLVIFAEEERGRRLRRKTVSVTDGYTTFADIPKILEIIHGPVFITHARFIRTIPKEKHDG